MADMQILFAAEVNQDSVTRLINEVTGRVGKGDRSLLLGLSTPGGNVNWGVTAYGLLRGLGIEVTTHNIGQVDSIGGPIYASGDKRLCTRQGRFLIHSVYWGFGAGANPSEKEVSDILDSMKADRDRIATILSERSGKDLDAVRSDMRNTRILNANEAKDYGLVHEITDDVFDPAQEVVNIGA
jgi:ATP-dependent Clp protease, protease subunit